MALPIPLRKAILRSTVMHPYRNLRADYSSFGKWCLPIYSMDFQYTETVTVLPQLGKVFIQRELAKA